MIPFKRSPKEIVQMMISRGRSLNIIISIGKILWRPNTHMELSSLYDKLIQCIPFNGDPF